MGGHTSHLIHTINLGGSREALQHALQLPGQVLLLQEHRHSGPALPALQGLARQAGWHGIWVAATTHKHCGRSGGMSVLVRIPLQVHRGAELAKCTAAIVPWSRTARLHVLSVYGYTRSNPEYQCGSSRLQADVQTYIAGLGNVPWLIGGDWNFEHPDIPSFWSRPHLVVPPLAPTQKFGRILVWFMTGRTVPSVFHTTQLIPGTAYVAASLRLRGGPSEPL